MSNYSKRDYYNQIRFPYYKSFGQSYFCYTVCVDFSHLHVDISVVVISLFAMLLSSAIVRDIFKKQFKKKKILQIVLIIIFWSCFFFPFSSAFVLSLSMVLFVSQYAFGTLLSKVTSDNRSINLLLYVVFCIVLCVILTVH